MESHHKEAIDVFLNRYSDDDTVLAILLGGSLAHGYARFDSDIDITIVVSPEEFRKRKEMNKLAFSIWDICTYQNGYIDCKVVDIDYMKLIAEKGSDASRYAFKDSKVLFSRIDGLEVLLSNITKYPVDQMDSRRKRFASQILAWRWFFGEGLKKENRYLQILAVQKLVLFSTRIVMNENMILYPFHKWMLKELENAKHVPEKFNEYVSGLLNNPGPEEVESLFNCVFNYLGYTEDSVDWPNYFMTDSEQNWITHEPPVDDL